MPFDATPRMTPAPSVIFLPGMKVPGGENTETHAGARIGRPAHDLDRRAVPASTKQTRSRSAFGWGFASMTRATVKPASFAAGSTTLDFEADAGQRVGDLAERRLRLEVLLEPGEGEFHGAGLEQRGLAGSGERAPARVTASSPIASPACMSVAVERAAERRSGIVIRRVSRSCRLTNAPPLLAAADRLIAAKASKRLF